MDYIISQIRKSKYLVWILKAVVMLLVLHTIFSSFFADGISSYFSHRDYSFQNDFSGAVTCDGKTELIQKFRAKGNILSNITLYLEGLAEAELTLEIINESGTAINTSMINLSDCTQKAWNTIDLNCNRLVRGRDYGVKITGSDLSAITLNTGNKYPGIFGECIVDGTTVQHSLAMGIQNTYTYLMLGNGLEFFVKLLFCFIMAGILCYTVLHFEKIFAVFKKTDRTQGFLYALYFAVYTVLLFNPIDAVRTEVTKFSRIIGIGMISGVDVSKRVSNFMHWFFCFAVVFFLFYLLANYLKTREYSKEDQKVISFLDNFVILANVVQLIHCICYFYDKSQTTSIFYYSEYAVMALILICIAYIMLDLNKKINIVQFEQLLICGVLFAFPLTIFLTFGPQEWDSGKLLMGVQMIVSLLLLVLIRILKIDWNGQTVAGVLEGSVVCLSFLPFATSFFIEFVAILNQHEIFWKSIGRDYFYAVVLGLMVMGVIVTIIIRKGIQIKKWKNIVYPTIIFGIVCLWRQVEISATYSADLFETANASILTSDFLNFGAIPIVEHYGGHMMSQVWEGIIYGLLNNDFAGAIFSPYSGYISTVITVLFYFLVRHLWNEDLAVLVVLFFPFYNSVSYWGAGILMCLTVMAFIRKNTYKRGVAFWLAFAWCTLYRLDLGFAFVLACVITLAWYVIFERNWKALKQITVSMAFVAGVTGAVWCVLCLIKGLNPITRLLEFLLLSASNQNWARAGIGTDTLSMYAWTYIFVPFTVVLCLLYTICSKKLRSNISQERWSLILILGFSFIYNYSRGLIRHSLLENQLTLIMWTAYIFFAVFIVSLKNNAKFFYLYLQY